MPKSSRPANITEKPEMPRGSLNYTENSATNLSESYGKLNATTGLTPNSPKQSDAHPNSSRKSSPDGHADHAKMRTSYTDVIYAV